MEAIWLYEIGSFYQQEDGDVPVEEIVTKMRKLYDSRAQDYVVATGSYEAFPGLREDAERFCARSPRDGKLLDLGCGVGRDSEYFLSLGREVVAADLSAEMLRVTSRRCSGYGDLRLVQLEMSTLPFRNDSFAGIWLCASLLHLPSHRIRPTLLELVRILRSGGIAAISMKAGEGEGWYAGRTLAECRWFTFVRPEEFVLDLIWAGFSTAKIISSGRREWFLVEAKKA